MTIKQLKKELEIYKEASEKTLRDCEKKHFNTDYVSGYLSAITLFLDKINGKADLLSINKKASK